MAVSDADRERVTRLLGRDVEATLGVDHLTVVRDTATQMREYIDDADYYVRHVVEDVQQYFHDSFVDTTWPACPRHPNHPLWFKDGWWWCERDAVAVAKLGELVQRQG